VRRDIAKVSPAERDAFRDAIIQLNATNYPDGVSFWDKQDEIHQATHVHGGPAFLPWHRELCNRFEELLQTVDSSLFLHYWDWTTDPRSAPDGSGGFVNLFSTGPNGFMGSSSGLAGPPLQAFNVQRQVTLGLPAVASDNSILTSANVLPQNQQYQQFRLGLEAAHDYIHGYIGGHIGSGHSAFEDPFVFLLHSNVDRLFACWQRAIGQAWRLDPNQVYGVEGSDPDIVQNMEPWAGGSGLRPWAPPENQQVSKTSKHATVVAPPPYDTCRPKLKFADEGGIKKVLDDPIKLKVRDDGPFKKFVDDRATVKFLDDGGVKKIRDDPIKQKFTDDPMPKDPREGIKFSGRDVQQLDPRFIEEFGWLSGAVPFVLATPHHSLAWMGTAAPSSEREAEILDLESRLLEVEQALAVGASQLGALQSEHQALLKRYEALTGHEGEAKPESRKEEQGQDDQGDPRSS
jgi:Common central domain of tyrosinase